MATRRNARAGVEDRWHRPARRGEQVHYPADAGPGDPVWCTNAKHGQVGTLVCAGRHDQGHRWQARWVGDGQERSKSFAKKTDAEACVKQVTADVVTGTYVDTRRSAVTFGTVAEAWLNTKESANKAPKTIGGYRGVLDVVAFPRWEGEPLRDITHERLQTWFTWLATNPAARKHPKRDTDGKLVQTGLSASRVIQTHNVLSQIFGYAIRAKYLAFNPADAIELPSKPDSKDLALTHEQVRTLADAITTAEEAVRHRADTAPARTSPDKLATMVRVLAYAGLRYGECAALRVGDVDIEARRIMISKSVTQVRGRGNVERDDTKNHLKQPVPILTTQLAEGLARVVDRRDPSEYLFPGPDGGSMTIGWFNARFNKAVETLGIPGVTPHTLRHTAGSLAISETPSATGVLLASKLLRHKNVSTTANIYSHIIDGDWDKLATAMDSAVRKAANA
jgi:integrase